MTENLFLRGWALALKNREDGEMEYFNTGSFSRFSEQSRPWTKNINKATAYTDLGDLIGAIRNIKDNNTTKGIGDPEDLRVIKLSIKAEEVDINEGEILNARQRQAVQKLTQDEIEALGVKKIEMQNRLDDRIPRSIYEFYPGDQPGSPEDYRKYKSDLESKSNDQDKSKIYRHGIHQQI